jgi:hypothetical protein
MADFIVDDDEVIDEGEGRSIQDKTKQDKYFDSDYFNYNV